jgi:hypothetical protein
MRQGFPAGREKGDVMLDENCTDGCGNYVAQVIRSGEYIALLCLSLCMVMSPPSFFSQQLTGLKSDQHF